MRYFAGKRVLIIGGSKGIGRALATHLAHQGATLCVAARNEADLDQTVAALHEVRGAGHGRVVLDVSEPRSVMASRDGVLRILGGLDMLVCASGFARAAPFLDSDPEDFSRLMAVNYLGHVHAVRAFAPVMAAQKHGDICLVSSLVACVPIYGYSAYAASKGAIAAFGESLRQEMKLHGVRVGLYYPPTTATPGLDEENKTKPPAVWALEVQSGWNRIYSADEVARSVASCIERGVVHGTIGLDSWFLRTAQRLAPGMVRRITDGEVRRAVATAQPEEVSWPA